MRFFRNKLTVAIIILSVTFLILIGHSAKRGNMSLMENGIGMALNPIQRVAYGVNNKVKETVGFLFNFSRVKKENEELKKRNSELESKELKYDYLKKENERFRNMLNFKNANLRYNYIGCNIIGKSGGNFLDEFTINKGSKHGLKKKMIAVTAEGLVGQIIAVGKNWAIVQSLSNENLAVSAMIQNTNENSGIVKGYKDSDNKQLAKLYYLPLESKIKKNDVILTSGLGGLYPKGIRIGYVIGVEEDKGKVMKNAIIKPYVDLNKLQELFIVVPKDNIDVKYNVDIKY